MQDLSAFQRDVMFVLSSELERKASEPGPNFPNGLELKGKIGEYYEEQINHGRLYPNLDTLVEKGLVEKFSVNDRTNGYKLTERGRRELQVRVEWERKMLNGGE